MSELPDYDDFKDSLVAFVDVLGFDKRVRDISCRESFFELGKLLYATKATAEALSKSDDVLKGFNVTAISDSIIVTIPFNDPICTVGMLQVLHNIQYEMLGTDFKTLVRGHISRGKVYHKNGLIFGPGYSDAYKSEQKMGGAPRIVLDSNIVSDAKLVIDSLPEGDKSITVFDYLKKDASDNSYFIDYLKPVGGTSALPREQLLSERESINDFINESITKYEGQPSVKEKYSWLREYYEYTEVYY